MKYELTDSVLFSENGKITKGDILDVRGDFYVMHNGIGESLVSKERIIGYADDKEIFKDGGEAKALNYPTVDKINSMEFYRYYPSIGEPFEISYDSANKYGFGIYFLDDFDFYRDKFENARFVTIKPRIKQPYVFINHERLTPSFEYTELLNKLIGKGEVKDKNELNTKLLKAGFDSIVIYEPRGIYLIVLKEDDSLFEVISDIGVSQIPLKEQGGNLSATTYDVTEDISEVISRDYNDIGGYQGEILFRNFNDDLEGFFVSSSKDLEYVSDLVNKGYLFRDYEIVGNAFSLTKKGKECVNDIIEHIE